MSAVTDKTWDVFVAVTVGQRVNGHAPAFMTASRLGRRPLRELRELSLG